VNVLRRAGASFLVLGFTLAILTAAAPIVRASESTDLEACFFSKINAARVANGAPALVRDSNLVSYARIHSEAMYDNGGVYHSSAGDLDPYLPDDWLKWGENVGFGYECPGLFDAFMASQSHRENLLDPDFQYAGIGVYFDETGAIWTTHIFLYRQTAPASSTTTTKPPSTTTTSAPPPTTTVGTTTTITVPTTTTTTAPAPTTTATTAPPTTTTPPTTRPPATTTSAAPSATTTTTVPTTTTASPTTVTTTLASTTTSSTTTSTTSPPPPSSSTTTPRATTAALTNGPTAMGPVGSLVAHWEADGVLCSGGRCGGDQALLAFIGVVLLSGTVLTTWALRT